MNTKMFALLLIGLGINTLRYGNYLLEDSVSIYNWILFIVNLIALIIVIASKKSSIGVDSKSK